MASITVPVAVRLSRIVYDSLHNVNKNLLLRYPHQSSSLLWQRQGYTTITEEKKPEDSQSGPSDASGLPKDATEADKKLLVDNELLSKEVTELRSQKFELEDKYKRALAESENIRIRLNKQIEDAKRFGIQGFCKDLLEVADILGKATESVPKEELTNKNPHLKTLYEGLSMTEAQLHKVFRKHGLESLNPLNEKFDPNQHEALFQQDAEGKEAGTILEVTKLGYKLHDRVVRPALVGVAKG